MTQQQPEESEFETQWWELDPRSLAVLRVALGSFVLLTLTSFWGDTTAFFTDAGVLPRDALVRSPFANLWICFHMGSGSWLSQASLNGLLGLFAIGLILGWRTPWMTAGCWFLLNSLQVRNPFVGDRGDLELSLMLFWSFFLPLGARWSFDARAGRAPWGRERGISAAALITQFGLIYLFAAYYKNGAFWLSRGDGLEHSLISPLFATDASLWIAQAASSYLRLGNYAVIAGELFVGLLLFCPWSVGLIRTFTVFLLLSFHLAVAVLFQLGLFPWIGAILPLALLPKEFWEGWGRRLGGLGDRFLGDKWPREKTQSYKPFRTLFLVICLSLAVVSNLLSTSAGRSWRAAVLLGHAADALRLSQHWDLFSPIPPYYGSFKLTRVGPDDQNTLYFEGPATRERPELSPFPSHRWRMLMIASLYSQFDLVRPGIARELPRRLGLEVASPTQFDYSFRVQVPDEKGALQAPEDWMLLRHGEREETP